MTRAVILGGTGHIGAAIARHFDDQGLDVIATGRRAGPVPSLAGTEVSYQPGDDHAGTP